MMRQRRLKTFDELYRWSITDSREFWSEIVCRLRSRFRDGYRPEPHRVVEMVTPRRPRWFPGAALNIVESCFAAEPDAVAVRYQHDSSDAIRSVTYRELDLLSNRVARVSPRKTRSFRSRIFPPLAKTGRPDGSGMPPWGRCENSAFRGSRPRPEGYTRPQTASKGRFDAGAGRNLRGRNRSE